jgi:hypothetical protein
MNKEMFFYKLWLTSKSWKMVIQMSQNHCNLMLMVLVLGSAFNMDHYKALRELFSDGPITYDPVACLHR